MRDTTHQERSEQQTAARPALKQPYEPPKATFTPLKMEERLMSCGKDVHPCYGIGGS